MNREEYIKNKITEKGYTIKDFAAKIGMPYSTLLSILKGSIGGAAVDNVIKICNGLDITVNDLQTFADTRGAFSISDFEKSLILAYRARPDMQNAINALLGIQPNTNIAEDVASVIAETEKVFNIPHTELK